MSKFTIKDVENLSGIKAHTIRIWEQRYTFLQPNRTDTNIRFYSSEELKHILNIALLNKYGFKVSHINKMNPTEMAAKILTLNQGQANNERTVNDLIQQMVDMEIEKFEATLNSYIAEKGVEKTIISVIFPYLERVGILWVTDHINPAQEHLVTNIIRQKIIMGIEKTIPFVVTPKTTLLFLPPGEYHELGLLFTYFLMKTRGIKVFYLGANIPVKDVEYVAKIKRPDFIHTHLTAVAHNFNFEKFLGGVETTLGAFKVMVSGQVTHNYKKPMPPNVTFKESLADVMDFITAL